MNTYVQRVQMHKTVLVGSIPSAPYHYISYSCKSTTKHFTQTTGAICI